MRDIKIKIEGGPAGLREAISEVFVSFERQANTPQTRSLLRSKIIDTMLRFGVEGSPLDGVRVESDPTDSTRVIVRNKNADVIEAIENLERETMGPIGGWHKDPSWTITRVLDRHPNLPLETIMDILESGISIGTSQYGN
jgi:hypothetical protein